ncbi:MULTISPECIES: PTS sugar transporter subunit IIB [Terrabacteria group]|uniref:PTS sugar transporter subunit IIB n=1 Tax=Bacillati TaxID=1783272 RepID=UPI00193988E7|nr:MULTISPECIES: PTS sugar transporter subunit IIB [Terrabacteria group]MBW9213125.1 PTS sugar transporter subunit IIB [Trueperella sp. zg.1013]QRG86949.1 PTS sugar transporter subunit IIB [Bulleidia sp. zg-1006]
MYKALVACRAGMGSSLLLKIKVDQVIKENNYPIETEHGNLDSLIGYTGDLFISMEDLAEELRDTVKYAIGIRNIVDKNEIQSKLEEYLNFESNQ